MNCTICNKRKVVWRTNDGQKVCRVCGRKYKKETVKINIEYRRLKNDLSCM
ncbi:MAG: hypothetical protein ACTSPI_00520 [Candidatus Heimdallarchaeaceae archaeon]